MGECVGKENSNIKFKNRAERITLAKAILIRRQKV